jgi:regulator of sigma E protease
MLSSIFWVVVFISLLIVIHEFGHLIVAKLAHIPVEVFSVGFGPVILKKKIGETEYRLSVVPLGGFIKMLGEEEHAGPAATATTETRAGVQGYSDKPLGVKVAVIAAGPVFNLILGLLIYTIMYGSFGVVESPPVVNATQNSHAYQSGLRTGDTIVSVAGDTIKTFQALQATLTRKAGTTVALRVRRSGGSVDMDYEIPATMGLDYLPAVVGRVDSGTPAARTRLQPGDTIVSFGGKGVAKWDDFVTAVQSVGSNPAVITWRRAGTELSDSVTPVVMKTDGRSIPRVGVMVDLSWDIEHYAPPVVGRVNRRSPGSKLGLRSGDRLLSVAGDSIITWSDYMTSISTLGGRKVLVTWLRSGRVLSESVVVSSQPFKFSRDGLGLIPGLPHRRLSAIGVVGESFRQSAYVVYMTFEVLRRAVSGDKEAREGVGGPIGVATIAYEGTSWGAELFMSLLALLSINLFFVNLLPIPVLDGGRILLDCIAGIRRRKLTEKELSWAAGIGWAMIGALVLFTIFNDVLKLIRK